MNEEAINELKERCRNYALELQQIKGEMTPQRSTSLSTYENLLKSNINALKKEDFEEIIEIYEKPQITKTLLEHDLILQIEQLGEAEKQMLIELKEIESEIFKQKSKYEIQKKISEGLNNNLSNENSEIEENKAQKLELKSKLKVLVNNLEISFNEFMDSYYPAVTLNDLKRIKADDFFSPRSKKYVKLCDFIMVLLKNSEKGEGDYTQIPDSLWAPHLELLLRSGVAELHPDNSSFIRIVDFRK